MDLAEALAPRVALVIVLHEHADDESLLCSRQASNSRT